ncbi:hypothetical protein [Georgenia subflava]|uniref:Uncharacterized protein n=1 Tax=Georgenia subflava TaxID=1622177 RepID=A0A6N7EH26_9MICO|nr:hypothetical protein [Georgenia subflava]MPV36007.1 hypothetical protein [Georgenia subflava]
MPSWTSAVVGTPPARSPVVPGTHRQRGGGPIRADVLTVFPITGGPYRAERRNDAAQGVLALVTTHDGHHVAAEAGGRGGVCEDAMDTVAWLQVMLEGPLSGVTGVAETWISSSDPVRLCRRIVLVQPHLEMTSVDPMDRVVPADGAPLAPRLEQMCSGCDGTGTMASEAWSTWEVERDRLAALAAGARQEPVLRALITNLVDEHAHARPAGPREQPCEDCNGTGTATTAEGLELLAFLRRHLR